ncbi:hypothetical protein FACS1894123_12130 [Bacteroidia bacterium]|nr:hypothetical protein FACS1894123_12130 [Bacteroidia bacterium]
MKNVALSLLIFLTSCNVAEQLAGAYGMTQCKYSYNSIANLSLAGVNLQNASSLSSLNPLAAANLLAAFGTSQGNLPLQFTLNLDIANPGSQQAILNELGYILEVDGIELTQGSSSSRLQIDGGKKAVLPVNLAFDLKKVMSGQSLSAMKKLAFNFAGIGDEASNVTMKLQPSLLVGGKTYKSPSYIPVSFTLNRK